MPPGYAIRVRRSARVSEGMKCGLLVHQRVGKKRTLRQVRATVCNGSTSPTRRTPDVSEHIRDPSSRWAGNRIHRRFSVNLTELFLRLWLYCSEAATGAGATSDAPVAADADRAWATVASAARFWTCWEQSSEGTTCARANSV
jgi:hypothetical protein